MIRRPKHFLPAFTALLMLLAAAACGHRPAATAIADECEAAISPFTVLTGDTLAQSFDWAAADISRCSLQELRLLRSYPYAVHGHHFMEADIHAFFIGKAPWYEALEEKVYFAREDSLANSGATEWTEPTYADIRLTPEEAAFVERVDVRIAQLRSHSTIARDGYTLTNPAMAVNLFQFSQLDTAMISRLAGFNYVMVPTANIQLFHIYEENDYREMPSFVTTDLMLQAYHMFFAYALKSVERLTLSRDLALMCRSLYDEAAGIHSAAGTPADERDLAAFGMTFFAIPYNLLTDSTLSLPAGWEARYRSELKAINSAADQQSELLSTDAEFPYSLFKPRGYYDRAEWSKRYFKAMMWLQSAYLCREESSQLSRAIFFAALLNGSPAAMKAYASVNDVVTYLMGEPDNLSVLDIARRLHQLGADSPAAALSPDVVKQIDQYLAEEGANRNHIRPKVEITCRDKINFIPQRYMLDNEVLLGMADPAPNCDLPFPRGLDVFAMLGTPAADSIVRNYYHDPEKWAGFTAEEQRLKRRFEGFDGWNATVYNKWLNSLLTLQTTEKDYPGFMHTPEWGLKNLNTGLASWTTLKHDAVLYGEQPMLAECGGGGLPQPVVVGYVEPNLAFWRKLKELTTLTRSTLARNNALNDDLASKLEQFEGYIDFCTSASEKEIRGERLSDEEYLNIRCIGASIEYFTLSVIDPDKYFKNWDDIQGPDRQLAIVADVMTRNIDGCQKNGILYEATGPANAIYVVVEIDGNAYLTRGATYSYYEFVEPLGPRLTDEQWQQMLASPDAPGVPGWIRPVMVDHEPRVDERLFYSSGC